MQFNPALNSDTKGFRLSISATPLMPWSI